MPTQPIYAMLDTWSSGVTTYNGISMNVSDAASAADSKLINMLISSVSKFSVDKLGNIVAVGGLTLGGGVTIGGGATVAGSLTANALSLGNDLAIEHGGTGASTAGAARNNLGLGTIATQNANAVTITNGSIIMASEGEIASNLASRSGLTISANLDADPNSMAAIAFLRNGIYGSYLGLDKDNKWAVGGWTGGSNRYLLWHGGQQGAGTGMDADLLDGQHGAYYLPAASYTAVDVRAKLLTVDGAGSGVDADLLDGQQGSYYLPAGSYTASDVKAKLLTVDGAGSDVDADLLDGQQGSAYLRNNASNSRSIHIGSGTVGTATGSLGALEVQSDGTGSAMIAFHRVGVVAKYFGIDIDNNLRYGGWSSGTGSELIWHSGNVSPVSQCRRASPSNFGVSARQGYSAPAGAVLTGFSGGATVIDAFTYHYLQYFNVATGAWITFAG